MPLLEITHPNQQILVMDVVLEHIPIHLGTLQPNGIGHVPEETQEPQPAVLQIVLHRGYVQPTQVVMPLNLQQILQMDVFLGHSSKIVIFQPHGSGHVLE